MSVAMAFDVACVTDRLLVGGAIAGRDHAAWLAGQGVTDVISAAVELSDRAACARHRLGYRHVLWYDDKQLKPLVDFTRTLAWVRERAAERCACTSTARWASIAGRCWRCSCSPPWRASRRMRHGRSSSVRGRMWNHSMCRPTDTHACWRWRATQ